jgi:hypothetical protein
MRPLAVPETWLSHCVYMCVVVCVCVCVCVYWDAGDAYGHRWVMLYALTSAPVHHLCLYASPEGRGVVAATHVRRALTAFEARNQVRRLDLHHSKKGSRAIVAPIPVVALYKQVGCDVWHFEDKIFIPRWRCTAADGRCRSRRISICQHQVREKALRRWLPTDFAFLGLHLEHGFHVLNDYSQECKYASRMLDRQEEQHLDLQSETAELSRTQGKGIAAPGVSRGVFARPCYRWKKRS